jgi:AGCS family alanine or glycine:cation symporter
VYLFGKGRMEQVLIWVLRILLIAAVYYGSINKASMIWSLGDIGVGTMAWINIIAILLLSRMAFKALRSYEKQKKEGKDPEFDPDELNIKNADIWKKNS